LTGVVGDTSSVSVHGTEPPQGSAGGLGVRDREAGVKEAIPMRVLALDRRGGTLARCAGTDGIPRTIETALVAPLELGAILLVNAGIALVRLDAEWVL
jgi:hydrogenase maturation factor